MYESHVLLIADDAALAHDLLSRWQTERSLPALTVITADVLPGIAEANFDLVIVGAVRNQRLAAVLKKVDTGNYPVIFLGESGAAAKTVKAEHPRLLVLQQHEGWLDSVLLLAGECLRRIDLAGRLQYAEQTALASSRGATLGKYMLESRHDLNNSLTSVLGNAELLLLDVQQFPKAAQEQIQTIHEMALHMYQVMQRFSSIAHEVQGETVSQHETHRLSHASGSNH